MIFIQIGCPCWKREGAEYAKKNCGHYMNVAPSVKEVSGATSYKKERAPTEMGTKAEESAVAVVAGATNIFRLAPSL